MEICHRNRIRCRIVTRKVSEQEADGSWRKSPDLTAAAIQALLLAPSPEGAVALAKAKNFLSKNQGYHGGWGADSFTTSWAVQAIYALGEKPVTWIATGGENPVSRLGSLQMQDGGLESESVAQETRLWATSYALPAVLGKTWSTLMTPFDLPTTTAPTLATSSPATSTSPLQSPVPVVDSEPQREHIPPQEEESPLPIPKPTRAPATEITESTQDQTPAPQTAAAASVIKTQDDFLGRIFRFFGSFFSSMRP